MFLCFNYANGGVRREEEEGEGGVWGAVGKQIISMESKGTDIIPELL